MLRQKDISEWLLTDFESLVLCCDLRHNPELPEIAYHTKRPVLKKTASVQRRNYATQPYFPLKGINPGMSLEELEAALGRVKQALLNDDIGCSRTPYSLPRIRFNFVQKNITSAYDKPKKSKSREESDAEALKGDAEITNIPKVNEYHKVETMYNTVLNQMKQRYQNA